MSEINFEKLGYELSSLSVFRNLLKRRELEKLVSFILCKGPLAEKLSLYADFVSELSAYNGKLSECIKKALFEDENVYITLTAAKKEIPVSIVENAKRELDILSSLSKISSNEVASYLSYDGYVPSFENESTDFSVIYEERCKNVSKCGYGIFSSYPMFRVIDGEILPIETGDDISLESFVGYEKERQVVVENTLALIDGRPANNVLLYGDAGTGKSSTVKAVANMFFNEGVRLIELRKDQLLSLSDVMDKISANPLKFIIFIDDLSFNKNDDQFSMLKAALEGSASAKSCNAVIYATSNRRHIVKESFSDRAAGDDIHRNDTVQELLSLSERFGLTVYFAKPNRILYLDIVHQLAERYNVAMEKNELDIKAEAFALNKGSRSPRAAEQFIKSLIK